MLKITGFMLMIMLNAIFLNRIMLVNKVVKINNYVFGIIFIIISLPLIHVQNYFMVNTLNLIMILIYGELIAFSDSNNTKRIFNSGFMIGLIGMLDYSLNYFYIIILLSLFYYNIFNWRNLIIQIIGFVCPLILYSILIFLEYMSADFMHILNLSFNNTHLCFFQHYIMLITISILIILATYELYNNYYRKTENAKKAFGLLIIIITIILLHSLAIVSWKFIYLLNIPITIIITNYLIYIKSLKFRTFLLGLLLISFLLNYIYI